MTVRKFIFRRHSGVGQALPVSPAGPGGGSVNGCFGGLCCHQRFDVGDEVYF